MFHDVRFIFISGAFVFDFLSELCVFSSRAGFRLVWTAYLDGTAWSGWVHGR